VHISLHTVVRVGGVNKP